MKTTLTEVVPVRGVSYDKNHPETRQPWLDQRCGGITATEIRDWGQGSKRRGILEFKTTGVMEDLTGNVYVDHGNRREPVLAEWIEGKFGIAPCDAVYSHGENPRYLASPDGVTLDPFTGALVVGSGAGVSEIKTSKHDLHPGHIDGNRRLVEIDPTSKFAQSNYYTQMQWQMFVMNAALTLFVWEQHNGIIDPETGTFTPAGPPQYVWIPRDQKLIDKLVEVADRALEEIDAARLAVSAGGLPPVSELPQDRAALVAELLAARDAESIAKVKKEKAWRALQELYLGEGKEDFSIKIDGFATVTVSTSTKLVKELDEVGMRKRAPKLVEQYENLRNRYMKDKPKTTQSLSVTVPKS